MGRSMLMVIALGAMSLCSNARAEQIPVRHIQTPMHQSMVARSADGKVIASCEFLQVVQGDEVIMRMTYNFLDGSLDEETTTYSQRGTFRLLRNHQIQKGPFFGKGMDFSVEAATGTATSTTVDNHGKQTAESAHMSLPNDLSNGLVGTLLLNVPNNTAPFTLGMLAPVGTGRLIRILVSRDGEQQFRMDGQTRKATVFRIHPVLGAIVGWVAPMVGLQPKDVMVWVLEGDNPDIVRIVGQLGAFGPVVSSELEGASFNQ